MDLVLSEAVRVAERVIDHQVASLLAGRADLERLARLGIAALAGTIAITGVFVQIGDPVPTPVGAAGAFGTFLLVAGTAAAGINSTQSEAIVGPSPRDVINNLAAKGIDGIAFQFALLDEAAVAERHNQETMESMAVRRDRATQLLITGTGLVLFAVAYVVGGAILA